MTVALVHGVPECAAIRDPVTAEMGRDDVVTLSPPGSDVTNVARPRSSRDVRGRATIVTAS